MYSLEQKNFQKEAFYDTIVAVEGSFGRLFFETEVSEHGLQEIGVAEEVVARMQSGARGLSDAIGSCLEALTPVFDRTMNTQQNLESTEVEFGISISGEGNVFVVKTSGSANINVKLTWKARQDPDAKPNS